MNKLIWGWYLVVLCLGLLPLSSKAQEKKTSKTSKEAEKEKKSKSTAQILFEEKYFNSLKWRNVGPFRGGRSCAVTGVPGKPNLFYFGATGGGVWKSQDAGGTWANISDGFFGGSIGAVAVSEWDNNVIYVGTGEKTVRGNVSHGNGMWKSVDAGKTWQNIGLTDSRHICRVRIHPKNPDLVYAAALGHLFGPNEERGVFRSKDGGQTWEKVLYVNNQTGAVDLVMDPTNPRILYATTWRVIRTPYSLESGGEGSGLWKSTDGGDTWTELTKTASGLPKGTLGIIGVTVSPVNPNRVWAIVEAEDGGVFRSEDGGKTWTKINDERKLRQRAWYYTRIYADTQNPDLVYVLNVQMLRSKDGGKTYESIETPHGDHHDLWISPEDHDQMILADDGGAQVSMDGGKTWSTYLNQPTAQFYRVATDNFFPYRIYGGQQDNSAMRIDSRAQTAGITERNWEETAGSESAHIAPHPTNPDVAFGTSYGGLLTRLDHSTGDLRAVDVYPNNPMGWAAKDVKYRFQWNFPVLFSPHPPYELYAAANVLFKTSNEGQSWEAISPDLTRNDASKMEASGGPITKDNTSVEYYGTIFALAESHHEPGVIWTGSDDGLVYITRDGGKSWENITPKGMPEWMMINSIDIHPTEKGGAYIAGTRYKLDDFEPYLYKTTDYGKTWTKITNGIDNEHFTRVVRSDKKRPGMLYAGTESGMYISFDDGSNWQPLQLNLPIVPITDLAVKDNDLIAATQGRGYWILDDLTVLRQLSQEVKQANQFLYQPNPAYNILVDNYGYDARFMGQNPPNGVVVHYYLPQKPDTNYVVNLSFLDENGQLIRQFSTKVNEKKPSELKSQLKAQAGANRFVWDMRYEEAETFDGLILWAGGIQGPRCIPGKYEVRLSINGQTISQPFEILNDPRSPSQVEDLQALLAFQLAIRDKLSTVHHTIKQIRQIRESVQALQKRWEGNADFKDLVEAGKQLLGKLTKIEEALYQTKNRSSQDPLNYPIRLNNKLSALSSLSALGNHRPTDQMIAVKEEMSQLIDAELAAFQQIIAEEVPAFNQKVRDKDVPALVVD